MIRKLFRYLKEYRWRYFFSHSVVRCVTGGRISIAQNAKIDSSRIFITSNAELIIKEGALIKNVNIYVGKGSLFIDQYSMLLGLDDKNMKITIDDGTLTVGSYSRIQAKRVWIRFGGIVKIGCYTNINERSEIRADESVIIGDYNQISYEVNIWDTNTHNIYSPEKRAEITRKYYPYYGFEYEKPKTAPIHIGDNCWIGERTSILKGTFIEDNVIVGYNTFLSNVRIDKNKTVVQKNEIRIL